MSWIIKYIFETIEKLAQFIANLDYLYIEWILDLTYPSLIFILTLFILPLTIVVLTFGASLYIFINKHKNNLLSAYYAHDIWQASYKSLAVFWETTGAIWHGHEIVGLENIPDTGPALLIYYHAAMPIDYYYVHCKVMLYKNRRMKVVADRFLFKVPGLASLLEAFEVTPGSLDTCVELLKEGNMLSISPGGVREALFSDHNYEVIWGARAGFAKVAKEARVPIIPMFTENSREALRTLPFFRKFFRYIYEKTRLPLVPIYGMFPVKLRTYIGEPIEFDDSLSAEELKEKTKQKIEEMIQKHQRLPGSIFHAILDRFRTKHEKVH
ncbi:unnamed protein product [Brachionus calyciflorus]|uniref:Phospholipid/glycerol acyltransferase domain-containing protein n=1 Tax=Brachionus calyciflorus TaxID=104777 RepID=A0A813NS40_9BILA|nr:unnamed protein product [Brachionus calyciflorus]